MFNYKLYLLINYAKLRSYIAVRYFFEEKVKVNDFFFTGCYYGKEQNNL